MSQFELLNNIDHKNIKIICDRGEDYGDNLSGCAVYPTEYNEVQKYYPIVFQQQNNGTWMSVALFGFEKNENLFINGREWLAPYIPAVVEREPFVIGIDADQSKPMVHIDMKSPRVSLERGEPVFLSKGGNSAYLDRVMNVLNVIHEGVAESDRLFAALIEYNLIEPIAFEIEFNNAEIYTMNQFSTISKERLLALDDAAIAKLHRAGLLRYAYMIVGSITNMQTLVNRKNALIAR